MTRRQSIAIPQILLMVMVVLIPVLHTPGTGMERETPGACVHACCDDPAPPGTTPGSGEPDRDGEHCPLCALAAMPFVSAMRATLPESSRSIGFLVHPREDHRSDAASIRLLPPARAPPV